MPTHLLILATLWLMYFAIHSLLSSLWFKYAVTRRWPRVMPYYRMVFNGLAVLLLLPIVAVVDFSAPLWWVWQDGWRGLSYALTAVALGGLVWSMGVYDNREFLGLTQWRTGTAEVSGTLRISPLHRFVRHPWYFLGLLLLWSRDMNTDMLLSALLVTGYLVLGSWLEERKLIALYGEGYVEYCRRVPGLIPLPWRWLRADEAQQLAGGKSARSAIKR